MKLPDGKTSVDVVADFLTQVRAHVVGQVALPDLHMNLDNIRMDFWFTTPATWSEEAQCLMLEAIRKAGFGSSSLHQVRTMTEPEAAAFAVFNSGGFEVSVSQMLIKLISFKGLLFIDQLLSSVTDFWFVIAEVAQWYSCSQYTILFVWLQTNTHCN